MGTKKKLVRMTTVPIALEKLLSGQLRFMAQFYDVTGIAAEPENLEKLRQKEGIGTWPLHMTRKITPFRDLAAVVKLYFYLRKEKPFIVHSHTPKAGIVGMMAAKLAGVPHRLHTVAGLPLLEATGTKRKVLDFVEKLTYACATKVYPNSFAMARIIEQNKYCKPGKLKVLGNGSSNGIDTAYFSPSHYPGEASSGLRKQLGILPGDFVYVFAGRLVRDKGIEELVWAFERLHRENGNIKLLLVGDYENDLDPISAHALNIIQNHEGIVMTGWQNDVRPYFAISNVLAFPSYREGFPNVVMQAGAMGLPSVVTNINGCNEIIRENVNGLIIPPKNGQALLEAMRRFCEDKELYGLVKSRARQSIVSRFGQKELWQALLAEYRSLESREDAIS